jgi:hypothetical protein
LRRQVLRQVLPGIRALPGILSRALIVSDKRFLDQFVVDAVQGGAGTSTNMNANEVIANVALELMGRPRGDYGTLHPIDDVNMAQSTNDAYPSALRLAVIFATESLTPVLQDLAFAFKAKAVEFGEVRMSIGCGRPPTCFARSTSAPPRSALESTRIRAMRLSPSRNWRACPGSGWFWPPVSSRRPPTRAPSCCFRACSSGSR